MHLRCLRQVLRNKIKNITAKISEPYLTITTHWYDPTSIQIGASYYVAIASIHLLTRLHRWLRPTMSISASLHTVSEHHIEIEQSIPTNRIHSLSGRVSPAEYKLACIVQRWVFLQLSLCTFVLREGEVLWVGGVIIGVAHLIELEVLGCWVVVISAVAAAARLQRVFLMIFCVLVTAF